MKGGIYRIDIGNYFYFGRTKDYDTRMKNHMKDLQKGKHNKKMLAVWNKYQTFHSELIYETDNIDYMIYLEQYLIDTVFDTKYCLNLNKRASGNSEFRPEKGKQFTTEHKQKLSIAAKKRPRPSADTKKKLSLLGQRKSYSTCPYCNKSGEARAIGRWHFTNCKQYKGEYNEK